MSDLEARAFRRRGNKLVPSDEFADEFLRELPDGKEVLITVRRARSIQHQKFFFAMLRTCVDNSEFWQTPEELLDALKLATGHVERRMKLDGTVYLAPKSINFASMEESAFLRFKNRCVYLLATKVLGCDPIELMDEANSTQKRAA